jgi:hypothetical protein
MALIKVFGVKLGHRGPRTASGTTGEHIRITNTWHAVSIRPCAAACEAAQAIAGKRFLSSEGPPQLPLTGCTASECTCLYRHHADRRVWNRAAEAGAGGTPGSPSTATPRRRVDDVVAR